MMLINLLALPGHGTMKAVLLGSKRLELGKSGKSKTDRRKVATAKLATGSLVFIYGGRACVAWQRLGPSRSRTGTTATTQSRTSGRSRSPPSCTSHSIGGIDLSRWRSAGEQLRTQRCRRALTPRTCRGRGAAHCLAWSAPAAAASSRAAATAGELPLAEAARPAFAPLTGLPLRPPPPRLPIPRSLPRRSPGRLSSAL